jgi:hypothetical protein
MDRDQFATLFKSSVAAAIREGAPELESIPTDLTVELHGAGHPGDLMSVEEAIRALYLGPEIMYRIIDIGLDPVPREARLFVRASAHEPAGWDDTWDPAGSGPFKLIGRETRGSLDAQGLIE